MSHANSEIQNVERAPYELFRLVAKLGVTSVDSPLSSEQRQIAEAIEHHANTATNTILNGIEAIGRAISCAALNPNWKLSSTNLSDLGGVITHLAVEAQALHDTADDIRCDLARTADAASKTNQGARA